MKVNDIPKKEIEEIIKALENNKFSKSKLTFDFMDNYVAKFKPDTMEEWQNVCLGFPAKETNRKNDANEKILMRDRTKVREYFLNTYFPNSNLSNKVREAEKEAKKAEREKEKAEREKEKNMTPEERFRAKMKKLSISKE